MDERRHALSGERPPVFPRGHLRKELDAIKPVFLLAERESRDLHAEACDATDAWSWHDSVHQLCQGQADLGVLFTYYARNEGFYPDNIMRLTFVSNHDKNGWEGTEYEQFGAGLEAAIVLSVVGEGLPLIDHGQEAGNANRLEFFEKDPIQWRAHPMADFSRKLFALKKAHRALWNAHWRAKMVQVVNSQGTKVFSFVRENEHDKIFAVLNFSAAPQTGKLTDGPYAGRYTEFFSGERITLADGVELPLPAWIYRVFVRPP